MMHSANNIITEIRKAISVAYAVASNTIIFAETKESKIFSQVDYMISWSFNCMISS